MKKTKRAIDPGAMRPAELARLLTGTGLGTVTTAMIRDDIARGAPTNADGTVNLLHFAAWLAQREAELVHERREPPTE